MTTTHPVAAGQKPSMLFENADLPSFNNWQRIILNHLCLDKRYSPFLQDNAEWLAKGRNVPTRGFEVDPEATAAEHRLAAVDKSERLEEMLGYIASYCPSYIHHSIINGSTCMQDVWGTIRDFLGIKPTEATFMDLTNI